MATSRETVRGLYRRFARQYDLDMQLLRLVGFRSARYGLRAVTSLRPRRGDHVVELGCGTGANFAPLVDRIGPEGRLIGVDLTPEMLDRARERVERFGWRNVELVQSDMAKFGFPERVNGILSVGAFGYVAESDRVIENAARALAPGGRLVIVDVKRPERWPLWLLRLLLWVGRPFGVSADYLDRCPWRAVERRLHQVAFEEMYWGLVYLSSGTASPPDLSSIGDSEAHE